MRVAEVGPVQQKEDSPEVAALKEVRRRCNAGEAAGCLELGEALQAAGDGKAGDAFLTACRVGDATDCVVATEKCKSSDASCSTRRTAKSACTLDHDLCVRAANAVRARADGQEKKLAESSRAYADHLVAFECVVSGESFGACAEQEKGQGYRALEESVLDWIEDSCALDRARCYRYALIAASINGGASTAKKLARQALQVSRSECRFGDAVSCVQEGFAFLRGDEGAVDRDMAEVLFEEGCNAGEPWGCTALGDMYRTDDRSQDKRLRCTGLYRTACGGGDPEACWKLGKLYLKGTIVAQDITRATGLFRRACELGNQAGCDFFGDN